ncbi:MAG: hypothetical protein KJT03_05640, partial [Verrucomicrobiae bacterium]|nr:hypothetical protein [Verrucomicrobiae bacterium]
DRTGAFSVEFTKLDSFSLQVDLHRYRFPNIILRPGQGTKRGPSCHTTGMDPCPTITDRSADKSVTWGFPVPNSSSFITTPFSHTQGWLTSV